MNPEPKAFTGQFYAVTQWSLYHCTIPSLEQIPQFMKMTIRGDRSHRIVPVGGTIRPRQYWAITSNGIYAYKLPQGKSLVVSAPPPRIETLPRRSQGHKTRPPIALFTQRRDADECLDWCTTKDGKEVLEAFHPQFDRYTLTVLKSIGLQHPLFSISRENRETQKLALPDRLIQAI